MLVQDIMQRQVVTVSPTTTLPEAVRLLDRHRIRHLPVVDDGRLIGIVSDRDLKRVMASPATALEAHELNFLLDRLPIADIMTRTVVVASPTLAVEDAARVLLEERISALPVVDGGQLVGIVTETDLLQLLVATLTGTAPSSRIDVTLPAAASALGSVVSAVEAAGATIVSVVTLLDGAGGREAIVRLATHDAAQAVAHLRASGYGARVVAGR